MAMVDMDRTRAVAREILEENIEELYYSLIAGEPEDKNYPDNGARHSENGRAIEMLCTALEEDEFKSVAYLWPKRFGWPPWASSKW